MGKRVTEGEYSMPMMIYFASCHFSCPDIIFLELPRIPPNGFITCVLVNAIIAGIFGIINFQTCIRIMKQGLVAEIKEEIKDIEIKIDKVADTVSVSYLHMSEQGHQTSTDEPGNMRILTYYIKQN